MGKNVVIAPPLGSYCGFRLAASHRSNIRFSSTDSDKPQNDETQHGAATDRQLLGLPCPRDRRCDGEALTCVVVSVVVVVVAVFFLASYPFDRQRDPVKTRIMLETLLLFCLVA